MDEREDPERRGAEWALWASLAVFLVLLGLVGVGLSGSRNEGTVGSPPPAAEALRRENRVLRQELELAATGRPYLVLDLDEKTLLLKSYGVLLKEYAVRDEWVRLSRFPVPGHRGGAALDSIWSQGTLLPPVHRERVEILGDTVSPPVPGGTVAYIPPTPEEAVPTPPSFRILFQDGCGILVRVHQGEGGPLPGGFRHWLGMDPWRRDRVRVEILLSAVEAGDLYRAFQDGTPLLLVGPGARSS